MKFIYICIFIFIGYAALSQDEIKIIKVRSSEKRSYKCQELILKNSNLYYSHSYSYNGWQITDSICYENEDTTRCAKVYFATYDDGSTSTSGSVPHYEFRYLDCNFNSYLKSKLFSKISDTYLLSGFYINDFNSLLELNPNKIDNEFRLKNPVAPSLFPTYGIEYNEPLISFTFQLNDKSNLILTDSFTFENYVVSRKYSYNSNILENVLIIVKNRKNGLTHEYSEIFKFK